MAGVNNDQRQKNILTRLVDVFNFVTLTSVITTLQLALIKDNSILLITIDVAVSLFVYFLTIFNGLKWIFPVEIMIMVLAHIMPYDIENLSNRLLLSYILLVCCLVDFFFAGILFFWKKLFPAHFGFVSAEEELMMMGDLVILFINGCGSLFGWLILQQVGRTLGFVLVEFLGFLSFICCIYRLVYRWKEYDTGGVNISPVADTVIRVAV